MTNYRDSNLAPSTALDIASGLLGDAGCQVFAQDRSYLAERAGKGWTAAEIARSFVRANFAKGNPLRRRFLTALTKLGAGVWAMALDPIQTHHVFPPIPMRQFDWCAYRDPESKVVGWGVTEAGALADFDRLELEEACFHECGDDGCQLAVAHAGRCPLAEAK